MVLSDGQFWRSSSVVDQLYASGWIASQRLKYSRTRNHSHYITASTEWKHEISSMFTHSLCYYAVSLFLSLTLVESGPCSMASLLTAFLAIARFLHLHLVWRESSKVRRVSECSRRALPFHSLCFGLPARLYLQSTRCLTALRSPTTINEPFTLLGDRARVKSILVTAMNKMLKLSLSAR